MPTNTENSNNKALVASLACIAVAATSTVVGGPMLAGAIPLAASVINNLAGNLSVNIASDQLLKAKLPTLRKELIARAPNMSNHDLQIGLMNSLKNALSQCLRDYDSSLDPGKDPAHLLAIEKKMVTLFRQIDDRFLEDQGNDISEQTILDFEDGYESQLTHQLVAYLDIDRFAGHGNAFIELLRTNLPLLISAAFVEELKQNPRCWIAYQRSMLIDLRDSNSHLFSGVREVKDQLDGLEQKLTALHSAGALVDDGIFSTLLEGNTEVVHLMNGSLVALNNFQEQINERVDRLEKAIRLDFQRQEDLLNINQRLIKEVRDSIVGPDTEEGMRQLERKILPTYLKHLISAYETINLPSIDSDQKKKSIPLEHIYVALQFASDRTSKDFASASYTIRQKIRQQELDADREFSTEEKDTVRADVMRQNLTLRNFDHSSLKNSSDFEVSLAQVFQTKRHSVFLGDPGSGKSTIVKWLALQLARSFLNPTSENVEVAGAQIHCSPSAKDKNGMIDLGPCRLPIVINISEYAKFFESVKREGKRGIIDYCGHHLTSVPGISAGELNSLLRFYLANNRAVVFLDGMDEVVRHRDEILIEIRKFIRYWINLGEFVPSEQTPALTGGNQIVITSRIVGYHAAPLDEEVEEFYVRAMDEDAIKTFCRLWTKHTLEAKADEEAQTEEANGLINAIFDPQQTRVRDLATNPLLITILALLYRSENQSLPRNRVELYQRAISILMKKWTKMHREISAQDVDILMEEVATAIHSSPSEVITEHALVELLEKTLLELHPEETDVQIRKNSESFVRVIRQDVGLLSERGHKLYHFLHRTFQEFLAARKMTRRPEESAQEVLNKISDPIWREPLTMAISYANTIWSTQRFDHFVESVVDGEDPLQDLIPRAPLLIASSLPDMTRVRPELFRRLLRQFLGAFGNKKGIGRFPAIQQKIKTQIDALHKSAHQKLFFDACYQILQELEYGTVHWTLLSLACESGWQQDKWLNQVMLHLKEDPAEFDFPVDHYLLLTFGQQASKADTSSLRFRGQVLDREHLVEKITGEAAMLRLITCLYGGWQYDEKIPYQQELEQIRTALNTNSVDDETVRYNYAVRLDTELGKVKHINKIPLVFSPQFIYRDAFCTRRILQCLIAGNTADSLTRYFQDQYENGTDTDDRAISLLALAALGQNVAKHIYEVDASVTPEKYQVIKRFLDHLNRLNRSLSVPLTVYLEKAGKSPFLTKQGFDRLDFTTRSYLLKVIKRLCVFTDHLPPHLIPGDSSRWISEQEGEDFKTDSDKFVPRGADAWISMTFQIQDDPAYSTAVVLDTLGKTLRTKSDQVATLCAIPYSPLLESRFSANWSIPRYLPKTGSRRDELITAIRIINGISKAFDHLRSFFLHTMWNELETYPGLQTMALATFIGRESQISRRISQEYLGFGSLLAMATRSCGEVKDPFVRFLCAYIIDDRSSSLTSLSVMVESFRQVTRAEEWVTTYLLAYENNLFGRLRYVFIDENADGQARVVMAKLADQPLGAEPVITRLGACKDLGFRTLSLVHAIDLAEEEDRPELMEQVFGLLPAIPEERERGQLLRFILMRHASLAKQVSREVWERVNESFVTPTELNHSLRKDYLNVFNQRKSKQLGHAVDALSLQLMALELKERFESRDIDGILLKQMSAPAYSEDAFSEFLDRNKNGVNLNAPLIKCLDDFASGGKHSELATLLPLVKVRTGIDLRYVEHWETGGNTELKKHYDLLQAETGRLTPEILDSLISLIANGQDLHHHRATFALIGRDSGYQKRDPVFRSSYLSYDYLKYHYRKQIEYSADTPQISQILSWTHENIIDDDPTILDRCIADYPSANEADKLVIEKMLHGSNRPSISYFNALVRHLRKLEPERGNLLWFAFGTSLRRIDDFQLSIRFTNEDLAKLMSNQNAMLSLNRYENSSRNTAFEDLIDCLKGHRFGEEENLREAAIKVIRKTEIAANPNLTRSIDSIQEFRDGLKQLVKRYYVYTSDREKQRKAFAADVYDNEDLLKLLLRVATIQLEDDLLLVEISPIGGDALELLAAWAGEQPDFVSRHLLGSRMENLIAETINYHRYFTARVAAVKLATSLGLMNPAVLEALANAMNDVKYVREEAVLSFQRQGTDLDARTMTRLEDYMNHSSATLSAATSKLFASVSNQPSVAPAIRRMAMSKLAQNLRIQIHEPRNRKHIYEVNEDVSYREENMKTNRNLEDVLYQELIQLTGLK